MSVASSEIERLGAPLCQLLGCRYPIIQTAMGWVADPRLVAATCEAGAFGFLAAATIPPDQAEESIDEIQRRTDKPFGVNFHMTQPNARQLVELVIAKGVRAVSYGRGPSARQIAELREAGVVCLPTVGALRHAVKAVELGANAIVVQGGEGGGHTGASPTSILLPQVVDAIGGNVPVVAAGGFKDGRGLLASLVWGASGIAMGTRFLLTQESPVPDATKACYLKCQDPAELITSKALDGLPQRLLLNNKLRQLERAGRLKSLLLALSSGLRYRKFSGASIPELLKAGLANYRSGLTMTQSLMAANAPMIIQRAMVDGKPEEGVLPGGQIAGVINNLPSCDALIKDIITEAEELRAKFFNSQ